MRIHPNFAYQVTDFVVCLPKFHGANDSFKLLNAAYQAGCAERRADLSVQIEHHWPGVGEPGR